MKHILWLFVITNTWALSLKGADLLLQQLDCYTCRAIETHTNSRFSHIGIVINIDDHLYVAQAWGKVKLVPLEEFKKQSKHPHLVLRSKEKINNFELFRDFMAHFNGLEYDRDFLWSDDKIYCSELVYKLLKRQTDKLPAPFKMKFDVNREFWIKYYNGNPPDGELGNSPASFEKSKHFEKIGIL